MFFHIGMLAQKGNSGPSRVVMFGVSQAADIRSLFCYHHHRLPALPYTPFSTRYNFYGPALYWFLPISRPYTASPYLSRPFEISCFLFSDSFPSYLALFLFPANASFYLISLPLIRPRPDLNLTLSSSYSPPKSSLPYPHSDLSRRPIPPRPIPHFDLAWRPISLPLHPRPFSLPKAHSLLPSLPSSKRFLSLPPDRPHSDLNLTLSLPLSYSPPFPLRPRPIPHPSLILFYFFYSHLYCSSIFLPSSKPTSFGFEFDSLPFSSFLSTDIFPFPLRPRLAPYSPPPLRPRLVPYSLPTSTSPGAGAVFPTHFVLALSSPSTSSGALFPPTSTSPAHFDLAWRWRPIPHPFRPHLALAPYSPPISSSPFPPLRPRLAPYSPPTSTSPGAGTLFPTHFVLALSSLSTSSGALFSPTSTSPGASFPSHFDLTWRWRPIPHSFRPRPILPFDLAWRPIPLPVLALFLSRFDLALFLTSTSPGAPFPSSSSSPYPHRIPYFVLALSSPYPPPTSSLPYPPLRPRLAPYPPPRPRLLPLPLRPRLAPYSPTSSSPIPFPLRPRPIPHSDLAWRPTPLRLRPRPIPLLLRPCPIPHFDLAWRPLPHSDLAFFPSHFDLVWRPIPSHFVLALFLSHFILSSTSTSPGALSPPISSSPYPPLRPRLAPYSPPTSTSPGAPFPSHFALALFPTHFVLALSSPSTSSGALFPSYSDLALFPTQAAFYFTLSSLLFTNISPFL
ncbi:hypothetical protein B0H12DRAFT_1232469 [Mycena haematopus]|nr:hypothetical protein B0H12DRAFT_1232469 [Mycena haematopus]